MISEWRLSALVGQIRGVEYQLTRKWELAAELEATTEQYSHRALEPAASATSAVESVRVASTLTAITSDQHSRLNAEIESLEDEKRGLCRQVYEEGMQTGRWIGVDKRYVYLSGEAEDCGEATDGQLLQMHDVPAGYEGYMPVGEDPEITTRRVEYAESYRRGRDQLIWIMGLMFAVGLLSHWDLLPVWTIVVSVLALLAACPFVFAEGSKMAARMIGPGGGPHPPYLEVMPDSGERFDKGEVAASSKGNYEAQAPAKYPTNLDHRRLNPNDHLRGDAYAQIKAAEQTAKKKAAKKGRKKR